MPDLGNLLTAPPPALRPCAAVGEAAESGLGEVMCRWDFRVTGRNRDRELEVVKKGRRGSKGAANGKAVEDHVRAWAEVRARAGVPEEECSLPFLTNAPRKVECRLCRKCISTGEDVVCSVRDCQVSFHKKCANNFRYSKASTFKCPQHLITSILSTSIRMVLVQMLTSSICKIVMEKLVKDKKTQTLCMNKVILILELDFTRQNTCTVVLGELNISFCSYNYQVCFLCKQAANWRCVRCTIAAHTKCCPWPDEIVFLNSQHRRAVCWRHPKDWRLENEYAVSTSDIEEAFRRLPLPYDDEEFKIDVLREDIIENETEPTPYVHIKRNIYLVKKRRDVVDVGSGCTNCNFRSICGEDCECRVQLVSCSKDCRCSSLCTNRHFRKEKKVKLVKTQFCGWGVETVEPIAKGEFIIEYIGEVIDDAQCEQRLWDMKYRGDKEFYMCEVRKDFTIDATFKGNAARFLNHSCDPNCKLEKWQVDGETRVGVFALRNIASGEPLTYDYRFEHFGPLVKCHCGAIGCQGYLGNKKKMIKPLICWGGKRKRSSTKAVALVI